MTCPDSTIHAGRNQVNVQHEGGVDVFDRVVLATHSDTARKLRGDNITPAEVSVLDAIPYSYSKVHLHTGQSLRRSVPFCTLTGCMLWQCNCADMYLPVRFLWMVVWMVCL